MMRSKIASILPVVLFCMMPGMLYGQRMKAVDLGLSVKWANMNVGADSPEEYGDYFAWGEVAPKRYYGKYSEYRHYDDKCFRKYNYIGVKGSVRDMLLNLQRADDAASRNMGRGWRMPTEDEMKELLDTGKCVITPARLNGTRGLWVKNRKEQSDSIFLPMAGYRDYGTYRFFPGTQGYYWTSTLLTPDSLESVVNAEPDKAKVFDKARSAMCMQYAGEGAVVDLFDRRNGCVIRAVRSR
ncbi:MAG: hypothetical protein NC080_09245 [Paraprevotella sp.]|nr:hypothetical protein [Paraprevotella sp.]